MRVKAIKMGWIGGVRRRPGEIFEVSKGAKGSWFVPADEDVTGPKARGRSATAATNSTGDRSPGDPDASGEQ